MSRIRHFLQDQTGAITLDWVALVAGMLLVCVTVIYAIFSGTGGTPGTAAALVEAGTAKD